MAPDHKGRFVVVFDMGSHVLLMSDEEEFPERGVIYATRDEAIDALDGHMLASTAQVFNLDDSEF